MKSLTAVGVEEGLDFDLVFATLAGFVDDIVRGRCVVVEVAVGWFCDCELEKFR